MGLLMMKRLRYRSTSLGIIKLIDSDPIVWFNVRLRFEDHHLCCHKQPIVVLARDSVSEGMIASPDFSTFPRIPMKLDYLPQIPHKSTMSRAIRLRLRRRAFPIGYK